MKNNLQNQETYIQSKKIGVISLGCDKNRVDTERMLALISQYGFELTPEIERANVIIINTCSFIHDAKEESVESILQAVSYKGTSCEKVIVAGCLNHTSLEELKEAIPEVDAFVKIKDEPKIVDIILNLYGLGKKYEFKGSGLNRIVTTPKHYAYLKIADGCNNFCAFCRIPKIRGRYYSEKMEDLVEEAEKLVKTGVKELILVAQDVTRYGKDIYGKFMLVPLIKKLSKIEGLKWIRLHYCYPEMVTDELIEEIASNDKVCNYIDIPIQHYSDRVLKNMNRWSNAKSVDELIEKLRDKCPDISIRSTFIVGFPKETHKDYKKLYGFLEKSKLDNVGVFTYSKEQSTTAYNMKGQVPKFIKNLRLNKIQKLNEAIQIEKNKQKIGKQFEVVIDAQIDEKTYIARSQFSSPSVDSCVIIESEKLLKVGSFTKVKILELIGFDLKGELL